MIVFAAIESDRILGVLSSMINLEVNLWDRHFSWVGSKFNDEGIFDGMQGGSLSLTEKQVPCLLPDTYEPELPLQHQPRCPFFQPCFSLPLTVGNTTSQADKRVVAKIPGEQEQQTKSQGLRSDVHTMISIPPEISIILSHAISQPKNVRIADLT